jgi:hypothetical protein
MAKAVEGEINATEAGTKAAGRKISPSDPNIHHELIVKHKGYFARAGLDIEDYKVPTTAGKHILKPDGIHTGVDNWTKMWDMYVKANSEPVKEDILNYLQYLRDNFRK